MALTIERDFKFPLNQTKQWRGIVCNLNGGSVNVSVFDGANWVVTDTFSGSNNSGVLFVDGLTLRVTPLDGASYHWSESP